MNVVVIKLMPISPSFHAFPFSMLPQLFELYA